MRRGNPLVGIILIACLVFMAAMLVVLWVNQRPSDEAAAPVEETAAQADTGDAAPAQTTEMITVADQQIQISPVSRDQRWTVLGASPVVANDPAPAAEEVVNIDPIPPSPTPEPIVAEEVVDVATDAPPPTATPITTEVEPLIVEPTATPIPIPTATPLPTAVPVVVNNQAIVFVPHVVQAGDTMYNVAQRLRSSVELMAENGISSGDMIIGATISVPVANSNYCPDMSVHVVRESETVYSIASRFNIDKDRIRDQNQLGQNYSIRAGQVLCIPSS